MRFVFFGNGYITKSLIKHYNDKSRIIVFSKSYSESDYLLLPLDINKFDFIEFEFKNDDVLIYSIALKTPGIDYTEEDTKDELEALDRFIRILQTVKVGRAVLISSAAVYGFAELPFKEDSPINPQNTYGKLKVAMEKEFIDKISSTRLPHNILRISNVYGSVNSKQGVLNLILRSVFDNKIVTINNNGQDIRDFIFDKDLSTIFFKLIESHPKYITYNLSSASPTKVINAIEVITSLDSNYIDRINYLESDGKKTTSILDNKLILTEVQDYNFKPLSESIKEVLNEIKY